MTDGAERCEVYGLSDDAEVLDLKTMRVKRQDLVTTRLTQSEGSRAWRARVVPDEVAFDVEEVDGCRVREDRATHVRARLGVGGQYPAG